VIAYEILLLLDPELPEERHGEIVGRARELVERSGGTWDGHDVWGRRKLAYEINRKADGVYHLLNFTAAPETLDEISRVLKLTDGVMRHLAVRRVGAAPTAPAREPEAAREPEPVVAATAETVPEAE
jgi:small subunit ribosomal protein S6